MRSMGLCIDAIAIIIGWWRRCQSVNPHNGRKEKEEPERGEGRTRRKNFRRQLCGCVDDGCVWIPPLFLLTMRKSIGNRLSLGFCFRSAAWLQSSFSALLVQFGSGFQVNFAPIRWLGEKKKPTLIVFRFYWSVVKHFSEQFSLNQIQGSFSALLVQFGSSFWVNFAAIRRLGEKKTNFDSL